MNTLYSTEMSVLPIIKFPHPVLRTPAAKITALTDKLRALAADLQETMQDADGIGLAAPQVGHSLRLIVVAAGQKTPLVIFNPQLLTVAEEIAEREEGCLSMPGILALVRRPAAVSVTGLDDAGNERTIAAKGLLAACLQHEIDHLDGILFVDHVSRLKRERLIKKYHKLAQTAGKTA